MTSPTSLGNVLLIANPAAHSGKGLEAARKVESLFAERPEAASNLEVRKTGAPHDGERMAREAAAFDTVVALGGDGIIHEVANGLMTIDPSKRPALGIIPMGSGNDFARTIGASFNKPDQAFRELANSAPRQLDLGRVTSDADPEGCFFIETLSFGLDAAIALDTNERRLNHSRQRGAKLFVTSGIKIMGSVQQGWPFHADIDGASYAGTDLVLAIQNGPTYGGGFHICPDADPADGLLDMCFNTRKPPTWTTLSTFIRARNGHHRNSPWLTFTQARHAELSFDEEPPCQADGERMRGKRFSVDIVPGALEVLVPSTHEKVRA